MPTLGVRPLRLVLDTNVVVAGLLPPIGSHQGIAIVTARDVVERLQTRGEP